MAIRSFKDRITEAVRDDRAPKGFPADLAKATRRKLGYLASAGILKDMEIPPGNHLEALKGDREGQHSIRVHDQFRIRFRWTAEGAEDVELTDYH